MDRAMNKIFNIFSLALLAIISVNSVAATTSTTISDAAYTSIGSAATPVFITVSKQSKLCFASSLPAASANCHTITENTVFPVCAMQSGISLYGKSTVGTAVVVATTSADASLFCGSGGGGGGGGDASAANQVIGNNSLASIDGKIPALSGGRVPVDGSGVTQPISASALPLPTGASTSANQVTANTKLDTINTTLGTPLQAGGSVVVTSAPTTAVTNAGLTNLDVALSTRLKPADTLTAVTTLGSISSALPAGSNLIGKFGIDQTTPGTTNKVNIGTDGTVAATQSGAWNINNIGGTVSLPTGAATSALQTTGNASLSTIATNTTGMILTQGSTTSGQSGHLSMGAVTTANPSYTTAQTSPLSLDVNGNLRVVTSTSGTGATAANQTNVQAAAGSNSSSALGIQGIDGAKAVLITTRSVAITVTQAVTASSAYAAGNEVGGLVTFTGAVGSAGSGVVQSIRATSKTVQTGPLKLYLFNANPSNTTWTDKTNPSINSADVSSVIGVYTLSSADSGLGTHTIYTLDGVGKSFSIASGTSLYGVMVTSGTPTWGSTSDVTVSVNILQD